jgi:uncharacterized membrane protein
MHIYTCNLIFHDCIRQYGPFDRVPLMGEADIQPVMIIMMMMMIMIMMIMMIMMFSYINYYKRGCEVDVQPVRGGCYLCYSCCN